MNLTIVYSVHTNVVFQQMLDIQANNAGKAKYPRT